MAWTALSEVWEAFGVDWLVELGGGQRRGLEDAIADPSPIYSPIYFQACHVHCASFRYKFSCCSCSERGMTVFWERGR